MDGAVYPWSAYSTAFVEIDAPSGRLLLRPEAPGGPTSATDRAWADLTLALEVAPGTTVWIVTASDPYPDELDAIENERRARALEVELDSRGLQHRDALARSPDGSSRETSRAVLGATREAVRTVAAQFAQLAVFEIRQEVACIETATGSVVTSRRYVVGPADT
jgi:hypothetical protein